MELVIKDGKFVCLTRYEEREIPKNAGFRWDANKRYWWTSSVDLAEQLIKYANKEVQETITNLKNGRKNGIIYGSEVKDKGYSYDELIGHFPKNFFLVKPYYHQLLAVYWALQFDNVGLWCQMGTGKSKIAIDIIRAKKIKDNILVISVNSTLYNWEKEFRLNSNYRVKVLEGSISDKDIELQKNLYDVYIINYDALVKRRKGESLKGLSGSALSNVILDGLKREWGCIIFDESRTVSHISAIRTKVAMVLSGIAKTTIVLSGLPIAKHLEEIFCQQYLIDNGKAFGHSIHGFRKVYFNKYFNGFANIYTPKKGSEQRIYDLMYRQGIRYVKEECFDLPQKVYQERFLKMEKDQLDFYTSLKRTEGRMLIKSGTKMASIKSILIKFMQICGGYLKVEQDAHIAFNSNVKMAELLRILESELDGEKVVVVANFILEQQNIIKTLESNKYKVYKILGGMSDKEINESVENFNESKSPCVLVMSPRVGGRGISLKSSYMILYSQSFDYEINTQVEDRIHGIGRGKEGVSSTYIKLIVDNSVDLRVQEILKSNKKLVDVVVEGKKLEDLL